MKPFPFQAHLIEKLPCLMLKFSVKLPDHILSSLVSGKRRNGDFGFLQLGVTEKTLLTSVPHYFFRKSPRNLLVGA